MSSSTLLMGSIDLAHSRSGMDDGDRRRHHHRRHSLLLLDSINMSSDPVSDDCARFCRLTEKTARVK